MEMNLHMPQDAESESELRNLAAIPYQIISPANNSSIIGIFQDSMLGSYQFTRENITFRPREAMNLLMMFDRVNPEKLFINENRITNFDILSQILPPLSLKYKTKSYNEEKDDPKTSNAILEIDNGQLIRGQIDKGVLGAGTKGLIQRICNDFGNMASSKFIDDLQNIITEYMKSTAFSVGISDLISNEKTNQQIIQTITDKKNEVKKLIDQTQIGVFENNTGKTNEEEFETRVNNILNQATSESGKIGLKSLNKDNRFVTMVNAGSKGSDLNISFMISCLGQQNVDGKRIPYGFEHRTLPHFTKFDDSPSARGFVESSYINGLSPQELFFHAMGGRIGLIDTAVKSVTWETPIIIIENKQPKYIEIGKWIDQTLDENPEKIKHYTERQMELMNVNNIYIPTTDENGNVTWDEVTAITRHDPGNELYEIKTEGGRNVIVTESKSLLIWNPETKTFREMLTPDIKIGDCVPVTAELCSPPIIMEDIDMTKYFPKNKYIYGTEFCKDTMIPDKFILNEENGIFIGLFLAEGNAHKNNISITNNNENIRHFVKNWFDKHSIHWVEKIKINKIGGITTSIVGNSSILSSFLREIVGDGAINKHVPVEAFISSETFIIGLLNGYFSGDGTISKNSVEACSASKRLIEDISMLCSRLGIFGKVFRTQMKKNNLNTRNIKPSYRISIRAQWGQQFADKICLLEENKNSKLRNIQWSNFHRNFQTYNNVVLDKIIEINIVGVEKYPKVYDLTIPTTLNFGLANGLQVRDTSTTGYIQRRLIKGLEDLMVNYDMTVRNNKNKIVQFAYGEDGIDPTKVENQFLPLVTMSIQDIYSHYNIPGELSKAKSLNQIFLKNTMTRYKKQINEYNELCKKLTDSMVEVRNEIITNVFKKKGDSTIHCPVAFQYIIGNVQGQCNITSTSLVDITPYEAHKLIEENYAKLEKIYYVKPTSLFKTLYYYFLSAKDLLIVKRFNKNALILLLEKIVVDYKRAIVSPGEMVGIIAGQSIGEVSTQMSCISSEQFKIIKKSKMTNVSEMLSVQIGPFVDRLMKTIPEYTFPTGHLDSFETLLDILPDEYYIVGVSEKETTSWNKISHISRHPVNGQMMKVTTRSGRVVETTTSHSHLIRSKDSQKVEPIIGANMEIGMRIPVAKHITNDFTQTEIKIGDKMYPLDYLFGWFVGAYLAEGNISGNQICITNISEQFIQNTTTFANIFNKNVTVNNRICEYGPSTTTNFNCKELVQLLLSECKTGSFVKVVPNFAFLAPLEFKAGLIQAYFDGDGNFQSDKNHHQIRVCSRSQQLIKDIALLLNYFDIFGSIKENNTRGSLIYNLTISPKYSIQYKEKIGTLLHSQDLDDIILYLQRDNLIVVPDYIDKINGLEDIVAYCGKTLALPGQSRIYGHYQHKNIKSIGRRTIEKYVNVFKTHKDSYKIQNEIRILEQALHSGVIWDEVIDIEIYTPEQTDYVYDFTVPGNQTFMTDSGVIVHNTLNSVTYETHIIVRNREGKITKTQIGDFIEKKIKEATKTEYYQDKDTTYAEVDDYYEIPSCDEDGNVLWKRIEAVTRHPVINKDGTNTMLKITTKEEHEVIATKAKSFLKLVDGKIIAVDGDSLKVGDYLPVSKKQIDFKENTRLELKSILSPTEYIYSSEIEKAKNVMNEYHWWTKHQGRTFTLPYKRSGNFVAKVSNKLGNGCVSKTKFQPNCVYTIQTNMNDYNIPEFIPLDYQFGYLLGAYAAEGCMTKVQMSISNNETEYFKPIQEICERWNIKTKIYKTENKNQPGWTSQNIRIYNTVLCQLLEKMCGKLSHNKFLSDEIIFSNKECLLGFLDAYIGGDGSVKIKDKHISMSSVSKELLIDVQQILNQFGIYGYITKYKNQETNNIGSLDIKQIYHLEIGGAQLYTFVPLLNIKIQHKQEKLLDILKHEYKYEIHKINTIIPNEINGEIVLTERDTTKYLDVLFVKIKSIEEIENTTNYAYDLTVEDTRNFNIYNGLAIVDTFHFAGVASKSNVTRGVPRIEEILSLSSEPKNPSLTVYLKPEDESDKDKAHTMMYMLEHTKLEEIVKSTEICFDPDDLNTLIQEDKELIEQFRVFENMVDECAEINLNNDENEKSKWIIRIEMDPEIMLEKNITMDDVNFTLNNCYENQISCVYSDYNSDKLIFRIRMNEVIKSGTSRGGQKKIKVNPLDQSDQIYILKNFQDQLLQNIVLRGIKGIHKVILRKIKDNVVENNGVYMKKDIWVLDTIGSNLMNVLSLDYIDNTRTFSNDIVEVFNVLGIEAARQTIYNELVEVVEFDGTYINYHNYSVLCDRMTFTSKMISIFRHGINNDNIGPIAKASFEETPEMFLKAARHAELDTLRGVSANVMFGQEGFFGTSSFQVVLDIEEMQKLEAAKEYEMTNEEDEIDKFFGQESSDNSCSITKLSIPNNVVSIKSNDMGEDNDYNPGF